MQTRADRKRKFISIFLRGLKVEKDHLTLGSTSEQCNVECSFFKADEGIRILLDSDLMSLDTSDCPEWPDIGGRR